MDLTSELETMQIIENLLTDIKFKTKLGNNEFIDVEDFLNESTEDNDQSNMKSMYLTEPLLTTMTGATRNMSIINDSKVLKYGNLHSTDLSSQNPHSKSVNPHSNQVYVDIKRKTPSHTFSAPLNPQNQSNLHNSTSKASNVPTDYCTSTFLKQANHSLMSRIKKSKHAYKTALQTLTNKK